MADYRAISTGVASDLARWEVWDGSTWVAATVLPVVGDDVYANGFTITLDIDWFCSKITTGSSITGAANGGQFTFSTCSTLIGDVQDGATTIPCLVNSTAVVKTIVGNVIGGTGNGGSQNNCALLNSGGGGCVVIGDCISGTGSLNNKAFRANIGNNLVIGNLIGNGLGGGTVTQGFGNVALDMRGGVCTVTGEAYNIGLGSAFPTIYVFGGILNVFRIKRGIGNGTYVARIPVANAMIVQEIINEVDDRIFYDVFPPVLSETGPNKVQLTFKRLNSPDETAILLSETDQAQEGDVRAGTTYAGGLLTGTCAVPPAAAVSLGVPVDNTVGTQPTAAVVASDLLTEMEASNLPIAVRMRNTATDAFVTAAVAAITPAP